MDTSHRDKSPLKAFALLNMRIIDVTLETFHLDKSPLNEECLSPSTDFGGSMNNWSMFVTRETSQVDNGPKAWPWQSPLTGSASKQSVTSSIMFASVNTPASSVPNDASLLEVESFSAAAIGWFFAAEIELYKEEEDDFLLVEAPAASPLPLTMSSITFEEVHEWKSSKPDGLKPHSHEALNAVAPANM